MSKKLTAAERKQQILEILAKLLQNKDYNKITTAIIADTAGVSEATLYRNFTNKEQMFSELIDFAETTIFNLINKINNIDTLTVVQIRQLITMLLQFAENNPGIINLVINSQLISKSELLGKQTDKFFSRLELQFKNNLRHIGITNTSSTALANILLAFVIGKYQQFIYHEFKPSPLNLWAEQWQQLQKLL